MEGAVHPATVPKETCPCSEGTTRGQRRWLGKRSAGQASSRLPTWERRAPGLSMLYVYTSGATSSKVSVTFPLHKVSLCQSVLFRAHGCYVLGSEQG